MRQYVGTIVFVALSVLVSVIGAATKWSWHWWVWVSVAALFLLGAALSFPGPAEIPPSSAFIDGDATGSSFGNVYSDADTFVRGDARRAIFWNIIHRSKAR